MRYRDLDWKALWQEEYRHKSRPRRKPGDWDRRAGDFAASHKESTYADEFLARFNWQPEWTVLDAGCGPGTLSLPLARQVKEVTALDFSAAMLTELAREQTRQGLTNIHRVQAAWEDDWQALAILPHDVVIASRSLAVDDLPGALAKVDQWARRLAIVSDRVGAGPFDPDLFATLQRPCEPGPDYIFTVNILYQLGIQARVDFITLEQDRAYPNREKARASLLWMLSEPPLSAAEEARLEEYLDVRLQPRPDGSWLLTRRQPARWAVISWSK